VTKPEIFFLVAKVLRVIAIGLGVIAVGLFFVPFYLSTKESRERKRKLAELYKSRPALGDDLFYETFYASQNVPKQIVFTVRAVLTEEFDNLDVSRIVPEDDFTSNLSIIWGNWSGLDGLVSVEVVQRLEAEFGVNITDAEAASMKTLDDIIMMMWWKVQTKNRSSSMVA